jgi:hypothetical protein
VIVHTPRAADVAKQKAKAKTAEKTTK